MTVVESQYQHVIHRIDGLEKVKQQMKPTSVVIHRIDGLETAVNRLNQTQKVIHRIDGLEITWGFFNGV